MPLKGRTGIRLLLVMVLAGAAAAALGGTDIRRYIRMRTM